MRLQFHWRKVGSCYSELNYTNQFNRESKCETGGEEWAYERTNERKSDRIYLVNKTGPYTCVAAHRTWLHSLLCSVLFWRLSEHSSVHDEKICYSAAVKRNEILQNAGLWCVNAFCKTGVCLVANAWNSRSTRPV